MLDVLLPASYLLPQIYSYTKAEKKIAGFIKVLYIYQYQYGICIMNRFYFVSENNN